MKYFKSSDNEVYAYEADGSQDAYIKDGLIQITKEEADAIVALKCPIEEDPPAPTKEELLGMLQKIKSQIEALA